MTGTNLRNERSTKGERGGNPADYSSQTPAATAAPQANLRVVRHRFEGTSQAENVGASHDEADVFDVGPLGKRAGCKALEKELASLREKVEGHPAWILIHPFFRFHAGD
jgi:hypothetical protein